MALKIPRKVAQLLGPVARQPALARRYVDADKVSGRLQFEILTRQGCVPSSTVLEIGCGCPNAGQHPSRYLDAGNYVGIDPIHGSS